MTIVIGELHPRPYTCASHLMNPHNKNLIRAWLWTGIFLVIFMIAVGGITRLTGSGLSIVKWKIVTGILPPLTEHHWNESFVEYQKTPQFRQINHAFTLEDFKGIYWWEYVHRLAGRIIGAVFLIPFIYFLSKRILEPWLIRRLVIIFFLGALQGVVGWIMVSSGLNELPYVSHFRLALHLCMALLLIGFIHWTILKLDSDLIQSGTTPWLLYVGLVLFLFQTVLGAFVAGLKAGFYYNTFPLMGDRFIPENLFASFQNGVFIQFAHRWVAFLFLGWVLWIWFRYPASGTSNAVFNKTNGLLALTLIQVALGIITLLLKVPVTLGVLHQLTAVGVFMIILALIFERSYATMPRDASFTQR